MPPRKASGQAQTQQNLLAQLHSAQLPRCPFTPGRDEPSPFQVRVRQRGPVSFTAPLMVPKYASCTDALHSGADELGLDKTSGGGELPSHDSPPENVAAPLLNKLAAEQPLLYPFLEVCAERGLSADEFERLIDGRYTPSSSQVSSPWAGAFDQRSKEATHVKQAIVPMLPPLVQQPGAPPASTPYEQPTQHPLAQPPMARAKAAPSPGIPAGAAKAAPPGPGQMGLPAVTGPSQSPIVAAPPQSPLGVCPSRLLAMGLSLLERAKGPR
jgi:hypothetical protein